MGSVTIQDIAKLAGCAPGTVSRALNNRKGIRKETRERIAQLAESLGYQPNLIAQSLVSRQTHSIALIIPDISLSILNSIARAADQYLFERQYNLILCNTGFSMEQERRKLSYVQQRKVDGIIIRPTGNDLDDLAQMRIPTVLISHTYSGPLSYIDIENETAGYLATRHLLECGYRKIAFIGGSDLNHVQLRINGYARALREFGLEADGRHIWHGGYSLMDGYQAATHFFSLDDRPDSVFCCSDYLAFGAYRKAQELGIPVPDAFGIVGFNDDEMAAWPQFNLTTIRQPADHIGMLAAKMLLEQIEAGPEAMPKKIQLYPQLITRGTTSQKGS